MASAFIQYALTRGEGVVKKSMLCTLAKKLKIVDLIYAATSNFATMRYYSKGFIFASRNNFNCAPHPQIIPHHTFYNTYF